jgi:hypothetical protein
MELSVEDLLGGFKIIFDHRPNRIMRRKFKKRTWKKDGSFSDYMHQKIILGNHVPVVEEEFIKYIIDGIPDRAEKSSQIDDFWKDIVDDII